MFMNLCLQVSVFCYSLVHSRAITSKLLWSHFGQSERVEPSELMSC